MSGVLRFLEKQVMRGLGKGHGTKTVAAEVRYVERLLGPIRPKLCVDIGANVGAYSDELLRRFPGAEVWAFEPSATNVEKLTARFRDEPRFHLQPVAVGEADGDATLFADSPGSGLGSLSKRDLSYLGLDFDHSETIRVIRFEPFWRDTLGGAVIDLLKLDVEGHELAALRGAGEAIAHCRAVQFEFGGCNIDTRTYFRDFWDFFSAHGFALHRITPFGLTHIARYSERDEVFTTTNYIAARDAAP